MTETRPNALTVLVVEDEALVSEMITEALTDAGFKVCAVATAADALRTFIDGLNPDILFTDIKLPGDMDGTGLAECARTLKPALAVAYASGHLSRIDDFHPVPGSVFIPKPYDPFRVSELLSGLVSKQDNQDRPVTH